MLKRKTSLITAEVTWIIADGAWIIADVVTHFDTLRRSIGRATRSLTASVSIMCAVDWQSCVDLLVRTFPFVALWPCDCAPTLFKFVTFSAVKKHCLSAVSFCHVGHANDTELEPLTRACAVVSHDDLWVMRGT